MDTRRPLCGAQAGGPRGAAPAARHTFLAAFFPLQWNSERAVILSHVMRRSLLASVMFVARQTANLIIVPLKAFFFFKF